MTTITEKICAASITEKMSNFVLLCNSSVYELTSWMKNGKITRARIRLKKINQRNVCRVSKCPHHILMGKCLI
jgi:hypothetical protein